jgi:hypothetical protein
MYTLLRAFPHVGCATGHTGCLARCCALFAAACVYMTVAWEKDLNSPRFMLSGFLSNMNNTLTHGAQKARRSRSYCARRGPLSQVYPLGAYEIRTRERGKSISLLQFTTHLVLQIEVCPRSDKRLYCSRVTLLGCPHQHRHAILQNTQDG